MANFCVVVVKPCAGFANDTVLDFPLFSKIDSRISLAFITRFGVALLPNRETVLQDGDIVHVLLNRADEDRVQELFRSAPEAHS